MAPIGGGPPVGSAGGAFTGKAEALEIVGDFAYGYNQSEMTDTAFTVFEFQTGNYLFVGQVEFSGPINFSAAQIATGEIGGLSIALGGNVIAYIKSEAGQEDMGLPSVFSLIIPPFTAVKMQTLNSSDEATFIQSTAITGRIYRD